MQSKQIQQTSEYRKKAADSQIKLVVKMERRGEAARGMERKVHTAGCKTGHKGVLYNAVNTANIL